MNVLSIYASTNSLGDAFRDVGANVIDLSWYDVKTIKCDIKPGEVDVIVVQPLCKTYSIAGIKYHRIKNKNGNLDPVSDLARFSDNMNIYILKMIKELKPKVWIIENPIGGFRKMNYLNDFLEEVNGTRYSITYCAYGDNRRKPTDIFTNMNDLIFKPMCKNGDTCHEAAPRGSRTGTQARKNKEDKARIPKELCDYLIRETKNHIL